ncbi:hypothetical protein IWW50_003304 [Coemansia erecta]|nr:hypothetical protein GGF43_000095 [Coemansia sp. RSA 2618]KAJ2824502.1 hypothetical protein IWW50_003304 [Coemansia erecta]
MLSALVSTTSWVLDGIDPWVHAVFDPLHLSGVGNYWRIIGASLLGHMLLLQALPLISSLLFPRAYGRLSPGDRHAWCVSMTTLLHSIYDSCFILAYISSPALISDKMDGYSVDFEWYLAVALGYYVWDLSTCIFNFAEYGFMYLIHGGLGVFGLVILTSRQLQFYAIPFLLPELSSVFLHIRHLLKFAGFSHTLLYKANFLVFIAVYVAIRIGFEAYHSARLVVEVYHLRTGQVFYPYAVFFSGLGITLTTLNIIWLRQIVKAAYYMVFTNAKKSKAKAN